MGHSGRGCFISAFPLENNDTGSQGAGVWEHTAYEPIRGGSLHFLGDPDLGDTICQDLGPEHRATEPFGSES